MIVLSGAEGDSRSKLLIGLVRAAYNTDAVIVDSGMKNGIEQACHKKKVKLIGVCPEDIIVYPTKNSNGEKLGELTPGHSHIFSLGKKGDKRSWNSVLSFKMEIIDRLRKGRSGPGSFACRVLCVCVGDNMNCLGEVEMIMKSKWPVLVFENSLLGREISNHIKGQSCSLPERTKQAINSGKVFIFPESGTAEHLASAAHLHLTISL